MCPLTTRSSFWKCRYLRRSNIAQTVSTACRRPSPDMPRTCPYRLIHEEIEFKSQTFYDSLPRICPWPAHDLPITSPWPAQGPSATSPRRPPACSVAILAEAILAQVGSGVVARFLCGESTACCSTAWPFNHRVREERDREKERRESGEGKERRERERGERDGKERERARAGVRET